MKTYVRALPIKPIRDAINAVKAASNKWLELDPKREAIPSTNMQLEGIRKRYGESGLEMVNRGREELRQAEEEIINNARESVLKARKAYLEAVNELFMVRGEQLLGNNAAELQLLSMGLMDTPEKMRDFIQRNKENPALAAAAIKKAAEEEASRRISDPDAATAWGAIVADDTTEKDMLGFLQWFDTMAIPAAGSPDGYCAIMITRDNAEAETMQFYNLTAEHEAATGICLSGSEGGSEAGSSAGA